MKVINGGDNIIEIIFFNDGRMMASCFVGPLTGERMDFGGYQIDEIAIKNVDSCPKTPNSKIQELIDKLDNDDSIRFIDQASNLLKQLLTNNKEVE